MGKKLLSQQKHMTLLDITREELHINDKVYE